MPFSSVMIVDFEQVNVNWTGYFQKSTLHNVLMLIMIIQ